MREAISTYCRRHHLNRLVARSAIANGYHAHSMLLDPFSQRTLGAGSLAVRRVGHDHAVGAYLHAMRELIR
jgi:hypothetical protein